MVKVFSPYFGAWEPFAQVLRNSLKAHAPAEWVIGAPEVALEPVPDAARHWGDKIEGNVQQLLHWRAAVDQSPDDARLLLLDTDMYARRPVGDIFEAAGNPDLFYTTRPMDGAHKPVSTGILGVLVSDATRKFFNRFTERALELVANPSKYNALRLKYGGIQQPAFGSLLEEGAEETMHMAALPCQEWNAAGPESFGDDNTRLVHVHTRGIRGRCLNPKNLANPITQRVVHEWRSYLDEPVSEAQAAYGRGKAASQRPVRPR